MTDGHGKYTLAFLTLSSAAVVIAVQSTNVALIAILLWTAMTFLVIAMAYATGRSRWLGKRRDGSRSIAVSAAGLPYFALANASFALYRWTTRQTVNVAEIVPGLWFGRRPTRRTLRAADVPLDVAVLDLAAEFPRARIASVDYRSMPLLDGCPVDSATLADAIAWLDGRRGPVLVHCALGHGRTGSVVIAWMIIHGHAGNVDDAINRLSGLRRGFGLSAAQRAAVEHFLRGRDRASQST